MISKTPRYTKADAAFIANNLDKGNKELGGLIGRSADAIKDKIKRIGLKRSKAQVKALRVAYNSSHFEKGQLPHNYKNGETAHVDGYIIKSVGQGVQRLKHIWRWEQINGPLPKGHCLRSVDGNRKNTDPTNWNLISMKDNMRLNTINRYPAEMKTSMRLISKLNKQL